MKMYEYPPHSRESDMNVGKPVWELTHFEMVEQPVQMR